MGRPSKLTKGVADKICRALRIGAFMECAVSVGGVGRSTVYTWLRTGEEDIKKKRRTIAAKFKREFDKASAEAEFRKLQVIDNAAMREGDPDWKAAAWMLERKWPDRWARRQVLSVTRDDGVMTSTMLDLQNLTDVELRELRALIKKGAKHTKASDERRKERGLH